MQGDYPACHGAAFAQGSETPWPSSDAELIRPAVARPRARAFVVLLATLVGMAVTARMGVWQLSRAAQKEALQAALDSRAAMPMLSASDLASNTTDAPVQFYRRIEISGHWIAAATVFLDNRQMQGRPGFYVVTPLLPSTGGNAVLVQRGWVPRNALDRRQLPPVPTPDSLVRLVGHIAPPPSRLFEFAGAEPGPIRQNVDPVTYGRSIGKALRPLSVVQERAAAGQSADDGLLRDWPKPAADTSKHYGYAVQWFAMCAAMAGLYVWYQLLRPRRRPPASTSITT